MEAKDNGGVKVIWGDKEIEIRHMEGHEVAKADICRMFRVPPEDVIELERNSFSSVEGKPNGS